MPRTLPLELQLEILEQVLPPPTLRNSRQRRDYLISLALVHRSWTKTVLKQLRRLPTWSVDLGKDYVKAIQEFGKKVGDGSLDTLFLTMSAPSGATAQRQWAQCFEKLKPVCAETKALVVNSPGAWWLPLNDIFPALSRLSWYDIASKYWHGDLILGSLSAQLTSLLVNWVHFSGLRNSPASLTTFNNLSTLLLTSCDLTEVPLTLFAFFPHLSILAWRKNNPSSPSPFIVKAPNTPIRHLLLEGVLGGIVGVASALANPPITLTVVDLRPRVSAGLEAWCHAEGVELEYESFWEGGDLEMWAFLRE